MGGLFGGGQPAQAAQPTAASGVNIQTSVFGKAVAIVFGSTILPPNAIWSNNFQAIAHSSSGGGGKGGGSSPTSSTYTYTDGVQFGLCEGPITGIGTIWQGATAHTAVNLGYTVFTGTYPQAGWSSLNNWKAVSEPHVIPSSGALQVKVNYTGTPWNDNGVTSSGGLIFTKVTGNPTLADQYAVNNGTYTFNSANAGQGITINYNAGNAPTASQALNYNGLAYIANLTLDLGSTAALPNHSVEVFGFLSNPSAGWYDANPADVVSLLLTNKIWGMGELFPSALIGDLSKFYLWSTVLGLGISAAYTEQTTCAQILSDLATFTNTDIAWTTTLNFLPRGDLDVSTYSPYPSVFAFTDDDWLPVSNASTASGSQVSDPLVGTRADPADLPNQVTIEYLNRANAYAPEPVTAQDMAAIQQYGLNPDQSRQAHLFATATAARMSAQLLLQRSRQPGTWQGTVGEHCCRVEIGDLGTVASAVSGVPALPVRVTEITEQSDGTLTFAFEEIQTGAGTAVNYAVAAAQSTGRKYTILPGSVDTPVIFEAPLELVQSGAMEVWLYTNGGPNWAGAQVWVSSDDETYAYQGNITGRARIGSLTSALSAGRDPDTVNSLSLQLVENGQILSGSQTDADSFNTSVWVDGEIVSYATANLTGANAYTLSYLRRGGFSTANAAHKVGAPMVLMDKSVFKIPYTASQIGKTLKVKLLSFNAFGGAMQGLSDVEPYSYTILGQETPPDVTNLATVYVADQFKLIWTPVNDPRRIDYEVRLGSSWATGQILGNPTVGESAMIGDGLYWVAARYQVPNGPTLYSAHPISLGVAGSVLTSNVIVTSDQAALNWPGTFSNTFISSGYLALEGGDVLIDTDITKTSDIMMDGGVAASGTYQSSTGVTLACPAVCRVEITLGNVIAFDINSLDLTTVADITKVADVMSYNTGGIAKVIPQVSLSQDGVTFAAWQNWAPGSYQFKGIKARLLLTTSDSNISVKCSGFTFLVDVPDRVDKYQVTTTTSGPATLVFKQNGINAPFNGAPGTMTTPHIQYSIQNEQVGDVVTFTVTMSQVIFTVTNGGSNVARTIYVTAQGY